MYMIGTTNLSKRAETLYLTGLAASLAGSARTMLIYWFIIPKGGEPDEALDNSQTPGRQDGIYPALAPRRSYSRSPAILPTARRALDKLP